MFNTLKKIMKKLFIVPVLSLFMFSCSDSDDGCQECHLAYPDESGGEIMYNITNPSGGDEFCGDELSTVEDPAYVHNVTQVLVSTSGNDTLLPGEYGADNGYEVHCEEHGDHDH